MSLDTQETGRYIRQYRKVAGLTQEELAKKVGVSTMSIRRYENGERVVTKAMIETIASALQVSPYSLYSFDQASDALVDEINEGIQYKAQIAELMEKITTEGLRIGKEVFEAIAGNPQYRMCFEEIDIPEE